MTPHTPVKSIALYAEREVELWERAEAKARADAEQREGEVLATIFAGYLANKEVNA